VNGWELGVGWSKGRITRIMKQRFEVLERRFVSENPYHYMWVLKRK
jgi:hypothetical protein